MTLNMMTLSMMRLSIIEYKILPKSELLLSNETEHFTHSYMIDCATEKV
jgi:hypothetical protein